MAAPAGADLSGLLDGSYDLVTLMEVRDGKATRLYSSKSHKTILGHEPESCNGDVSQMAHLHTKQFRSEEVPPLVAAFEAGQIPNGFVGEVPLLHADGHEVWFEYRISVDPSKPEQFMVIHREFTNRRERERLDDERRAHAAHLDLFRLFDASFDLVTLVEVRDGKAARLYSSKSHKTILGHEPESCMGDISQMAHLHTKQFRTEEVPRLIAAFEAGQLPDGFMGEVALLHADGHEVWFEYRISIDLSKPDQFIQIYRDITERRERQRLEVENALLEVEQRMDEEAVHTISHQLKNRFIGLRGLVQSALGSLQDYAPELLQDPHNVRETIADLVGQCNGGIRICMSESVIRSIAHNQYTRTDTEFDLHSELDQLCGVRFTLTIGPDVPQRIMSDLNLILHTVENFTSNAGKYGGGNVRVHASALSSKRLRLSVHNNPGEKHAVLLERFGTDASSLFDGGVGVHSNALSSRKGLAIARKCASILGGEVSIRFEPEEVIATLDSTYAILPSSLCLPPSTLMAGVDDDEFARERDRVNIRQMNIDAASADHVRGGTADEITNFPVYVQQMDPQPSIVLLDQNLEHPVNRTELVKGTELIRPLRDLGFTGKIVVKSANDDPNDARFYASCGADGTIAKGLSALDMNRQLACILFGVGSPLAKADEAIDTEYFDTLPMAVLPRLIADMTSIMEDVEEAVQTRNQEKMRARLHRLKGASAVAGLRRLQDACHALRGQAMGTDEWEAGMVNLRCAVQQVRDHVTARIGSG